MILKQDDCYLRTRRSYLAVEESASANGCLLVDKWLINWQLVWGVTTPSQTSSVLTARKPLDNKDGFRGQRQLETRL